MGLAVASVGLCGLSSIKSAVTTAGVELLMAMPRYRSVGVA